MSEIYYILLPVFGFILGFVVKNFIPAYFSEKGKNLATKQDIKEITQIIEQVKAELSKDLELLKYELSKKAAIHRLVAEKEITAISDIGISLFDLRISTVSLRPAVDYLPSDENEKRQRFEDRYKVWTEKYNLFLTSIEKNRLFLPKYLYETFTAIRVITAQEGFSLDSKLRYWGKGFDLKDYDEAAENVARLVKAIDMAAEIIHQRYEIEGLEILPVIKK